MYILNGKYGKSDCGLVVKGHIEDNDDLVPEGSPHYWGDSWYQTDEYIILEELP